MPKGRVEAFSDGVIAILITILVLELRVPEDAGVEALRPLLPVFLSYVLSFVFLGIYWNNHHHLLHSATRVDGGVLWANLHLLFWLSLFPFTTAWLGEHFGRAPAAVYGVDLLLAALAYYVLQRRLVRQQGPSSPLATAVGRDVKGKLSPAVCGLGIGLAFALPWLAVVCYVAVAMMWLVPDRRLEKLAALT